MFKDAERQKLFHPILQQNTNTMKISLVILQSLQVQEVLINTL